MTPGYAIVALLCAGTACESVHLEPGVSYPSEAACAAALATKGAASVEGVWPNRPDAHRAQAVCLRAMQTITEAEDRYDALETVVVHAEPRADSGYVGLVEAGHRALVTGVVDGTKWLRVLLADGDTGFVYAERLRKVEPAAAGAPGVAAVASSPAAPPATLPPAAAPSLAPTPALARAPDPAPPGRDDGTEFQDCPTCPVMLRLPGGDVAMGSNQDPSERPVRRVAVPAFALGKYEVTVAEWNACAAAGGCPDMPAQAEEGAERRPMTNLSWDDARSYVRWLRRVTGKPYRLPSEAEWEYAARAGTTTRYPWGDQPGTGRADCEGCGGPHDPRAPAEVTAFPANAWGLAGMQGGVAEWVEDCWHPHYRGAPADGSAWLGANCSQRVLRGGSWKNKPAGITVSARNFYDASVRYVANGLRVALTPP